MLTLEFGPVMLVSCALLGQGIAGSAVASLPGSFAIKDAAQNRRYNGVRVPCSTVPAAPHPRAAIALRPARVDQVLAAGVVIWEPVLELHDAAREVGPRHGRTWACGLLGAGGLVAMTSGPRC